MAMLNDLMAVSGGLGFWDHQKTFSDIQRCNILGNGDTMIDFNSILQMQYNVIQEGYETK